MIYLNNAGTSWPKPTSVDDAMLDFVHSSPDKWLDIFHEGIQEVTSFFHIQNEERFLFTQSCSQSLAVAFSDFPWEPGDRLIISSMEHHALSRWFYKLQQEQPVEGVIIPRGEQGPVDLDRLEEELKKGARMVAMTMASNVTGEVLPYEQIISLSKQYGALCLLDGAQTAGVISIDLTKLDPDVFVFAGHKGPHGPQGIGGLYISDRISMVCPSAACEIVPGQKKMSVFPSYCDTGSAPMITIAGLTAGLKWLKQEGWDKLTAKRIELSEKLRTGLDSIPELEICGANQYDLYTGAFSIQSKTHSLNQLKDHLKNHYQIFASLGFQCAPLAHEAIGTNVTGTLRFSVGPKNTTEELDILLEGLKEALAG